MGYPTKEEREKALEQMTYDEIMHLAHTCASTQGGAYTSIKLYFHST